MYFLKIILLQYLGSVRKDRVPCFMVKQKHNVDPTMQSWLLKHNKNFSISSSVLYCRGYYDITKGINKYEVKKVQRKA